MKHLVKLIWIVPLVAGAAACGGGATREGSRAELAPVSARVVKVASLEVPQRAEVYGAVEADRVSAVSSRVMATVTAVRVNLGDTVRKGEVLVEIDPATARAQEAQARGALAQAQAGLALATRNFERYKALAASDSASELELDMARMQYEQAQGAVKQATGAVDAAASIAGESQVRAPYDGRVVARMVEAGDLAAPGRPLVTVESSAGRRLALTVPESAVGSLKTGDVLDVSIDARPDLGTIRGTVDEMSPGSDPASHSFTAKVRLSSATVASGLAGRGWINAGSRRAVAVPEGAVMRQGGVTLVVLRDADGKARSRAVTVGGDIGDGMVEVLSGLSGGEDVLVGLAMPPDDGAPVQEIRS